MFIRFLFTALIVYMGYRFLKGLWDKESRREEVKGKRQSKSLDLQDADVDDAHFEDIKNGKS